MIRLFYPPQVSPGAKLEVSRLGLQFEYFHSREVELFGLQNTGEQLS